MSQLWARVKFESQFLFETKYWLARFNVVSLHLIQLNYNCGAMLGRQLRKVSRAHVIKMFLSKKPPRSEVLRMNLVCFPSSLCSLGQSISRALRGFFKGGSHCDKQRVFTRLSCGPPRCISLDMTKKKPTKEGGLQVPQDSPGYAFAIRRGVIKLAVLWKCWMENYIFHLLNTTFKIIMK